MPIRVLCRCGQELNAPDEAAGKLSRCPACGGTLRIAASSRAAPHPPPDTPAPTALRRLRTTEETILWAVCLASTVIIYLALILVTLGLGLLYVGLIVLMTYISLALIIAQVRADGIRVGPEQLPEVYASACRAAKTFGMQKVPEVYVVEQGGVLNAFATKFAFRGWVVVYSDILDACEGDPALLDMIMAHEIGHLALRHIRWRWILLPAMFVPLLSQAYSRACEYSADRCGMAGCTSSAKALRALLILAANGKYARMASLEAFLNQGWRVRGFWQTVMEWFSTHPWLTRRAMALRLLASTTPSQSASAVASPTGVDL